MKRKIIALGVALSVALCVFASSALTSLAAGNGGCTGAGAVNGIHYWADTKVVGGHIEVIGYHSYPGYDDNHKAIIKNDCLLTQTCHHVVAVCVLCGAEDYSQASVERLPVEHSIIHD